MKKVPYNKPALTYADQLAQVKFRGLIIPDEEEFLSLLELKSYYRLSGYWYPLLADKQNHIFKLGSSFETAFSIYKFDRELRQLVTNEMEKIEIAVRAKMIYILAHNFGPYWYTNSNLFVNKKRHAETINKITDEFNRSDAQFIRAFKKKYSDPLPPCWTAFEIISFGSLSKLYNNFKPGKSKRELAHWFGLDDKSFGSWLHSLVYVRNVCAHHSRLWNRVMRIQPAYPTAPLNQWLKNSSVHNNRTYYILSIIVYLLQSLDNGHTLVEDLKILLTKYDNIYPVAMGFPPDWEQELLWNTK